MHFDVNALDNNGESALHQLFKASKRTHCERSLYLAFRSEGYDTDSLMEYLGKHFSLFGRKGYGPCLLL